MKASFVVLTGVCLLQHLVFASTRIEHVVVLMMENRSFDHLLGWLATDYTKEIDGLEDGMSCPIDPTDPQKGTIPITRWGYDIGLNIVIFTFTSQPHA